MILRIISMLLVIALITLGIIEGESWWKMSLMLLWLLLVIYDFMQWQKRAGRVKAAAVNPYREEGGD